MQLSVGDLPNGDFRAVEKEVSMFTIASKVVHLDNSTSGDTICRSSVPPS